jgi:hypothetical protein
VRVPRECLVLPLHAHLTLTPAHQTKALALPKEHEMDPRDKYTVFSRSSKGYRKGIHKVPKFTRVRAPAVFLPRDATDSGAHASSHSASTRSVSELAHLDFILYLTHCFAP